MVINVEENPNLEINIKGRITVYNYKEDKKYKLQKNKKINVDVQKLFSSMDIEEKSKYTDVSITELDYPVDLDTLEEYINIIFTNITEDFIENLNKNDSELLAFKQFVEGSLGQSCQIIFTKKSLNNLLRKINNLPTIDEKYDVIYLYDGINFYIYNPFNKDSLFLFPIKKNDDSMDKIIIVPNFECFAYFIHKIFSFCIQSYMIACIIIVCFSFKIPSLW